MHKAAAMSRRKVVVGAAGCAGATLVSRSSARAEADETTKFVASFVGKAPVASDRVRLAMPGVFPNGYTVPLALDIASPMTDADHVKVVRVLAPKNPLVEVATFRFTPGRSVPRVATRIRLAEPQFVVAVAEMSDGTLLMAKTWVEVESNGCK